MNAPTRPHEVVQLDLFGEVAAAQHHRHVAALTALRDSVPEALQLVVALACPHGRDSRTSRRSGDWVYCVSTAGLRVQAVAEQALTGHGTPAHLVTWAELGGLVGPDPRRAQIKAWVDSLATPNLTNVLGRPHELWPDPQGWHISYLCRDHLDPDWTARRRAWALLQDLLTDTLTTLAP